jgi:phosphoenolpyruvate synthase/pyruvate phosphate dikinase
MPEIMHPAGGHARRNSRTCGKVTEETSSPKVAGGRGLQARQSTIPIGTMIEVPAPAVTADEIAENADFFSFGTNDLTQMTFGFIATTSAPSCPTTCGKEMLADRPLPDARHRRASASSSRSR